MRGQIPWVTTVANSAQLRVIERCSRRRRCLGQARSIVNVGTNLVIGCIQVSASAYLGNAAALARNIGAGIQIDGLRVHAPHLDGNARAVVDGGRRRAVNGTRRSASAFDVHVGTKALIMSIGPGIKRHVVAAQATILFGNAATGRVARGRRIVVGGVSVKATGAPTTRTTTAVAACGTHVVDSARA